MCEHFVARAAEPFRLDELWPLAKGLERYGVAGFSWGAAWLSGTGELCHHRSVAAFRDDPARDAVGANETTTALVHLRRPSKFSTIGLADTQPFLDPAGRFAFSHNGELTEHKPWRRRFLDQGRIHGRADSEVGMRWLEDRWPPPELESSAPEPNDRAPEPDVDLVVLLRELHRTFGGKANLAAIDRRGAAAHYDGNEDNPVFAYRLGRIGVASTAVYSIDRAIFRLVAPGATDRRLVRPGAAVRLGPTGRADVA